MQKEEIGYIFTIKNLDFAIFDAQHCCSLLLTLLVPSNEYLNLKEQLNIRIVKTVMAYFFAH